MKRFVCMQCLSFFCFSGLVFRTLAIRLTSITLHTPIIKRRTKQRSWFSWKLVTWIKGGAHLKLYVWYRGTILFILLADGNRRKSPNQGSAISFMCALLSVWIDFLQKNIRVRWDTLGTRLHSGHCRLRRSIPHLPLPAMILSVKLLMQWLKLVEFQGLFWTVVLIFSNW